MTFGGIRKEEWNRYQRRGKTLGVTETDDPLRWALKEEISEEGEERKGDVEELN